MKTRKKILIACLIGPIFLIASFSGIRLSIATNNGQKTNNEKNIPILFIPGTDYKSSSWQVMINNFVSDGWNSSYLYNPTFTALACQLKDKANEIMSWVNSLLNTTKSNKVNIIAQGSGGIEARYYVKYLAGMDKVDHFIDLGTPNHGNTAGCYSTTDPNVIKLNEGDETPGGVLNDTIGNRTGPFGIEHYNGTHIPGTVKYISLYSNQDFAVSIVSAPLDGALNILFNNTNVYHSSFYSDPNVYSIVENSITNYANLTETVINAESISVQTSSYPTTSSQSKNTDGFSILFSSFSISLLVILRKKGRIKK